MWAQKGQGTCMSLESERGGFASLSLNRDNRIYLLSCICWKTKWDNSGKVLGPVPGTR